MCAGPPHAISEGNDIHLSRFARALSPQRPLGWIWRVKSNADPSASLRDDKRGKEGDKKAYRDHNNGEEDDKKGLPGSQQWRGGR